MDWSCESRVPFGVLWDGCEGTFVFFVNGVESPHKYLCFVITAGNEWDCGFILSGQMGMTINVSRRFARGNGYW